MSKPEALYGELQGVVGYWYHEMDLDMYLKQLMEKADDLKTDCEGFRKLATESTLRGAENRKKLEAVKSWVEYELIEYDKRRLHFAAYKLERDRHDRLIQLDKTLKGAS